VGVERIEEPDEEAVLLESAVVASPDAASAVDSAPESPAPEED
jgi:hypothetical protein